jgi:hypothetical protein
LYQQQAVVPLAPAEGRLRRFALGHFLFQLPVRVGQIRAVPVQRLDHLIQADVGLERGVMSFLDRGDGLGKKRSRPPHHRLPGSRGVTRQDEANQRLLVNPGQIQRLQPAGHGLPAQAPGRRAAGR